MGFSGAQRLRAARSGAWRGALPTRQPGEQLEAAVQGSRGTKRLRPVGLHSAANQL